jgi:hypothetical protein
MIKPHLTLQQAHMRFWAVPHMTATVAGATHAAQLAAGGAPQGECCILLQYACLYMCLAVLFDIGISLVC